MKELLLFQKASIAHISSKNIPKELTVFCYLTIIYSEKNAWNRLLRNVASMLYILCFCFVVFVLFCFVFIASLNSVSFWVISTSQRLRKLIEFWDHFISLHLYSLCSSFFWYVCFYLEWGDLNFINHHLFFSLHSIPYLFLKKNPRK